MSAPITWTTTHGDTVEVYESGWDRKATGAAFVDEPLQWRYRVRAANSKIVEWGESYTRRRAAVKAAERHHPRVAQQEVVVGQLWRSSDEPNPSGRALCPAQSPGEIGYLCCRRAGHNVPHIAGDGTRAVAVWA